MKRIEVHTDRDVLIRLVKQLNKLSGSWESKLSSKGLILTKVVEKDIVKNGKEALQRIRER